MKYPSAVAILGRSSDGLGSFAAAASGVVRCMAAAPAAKQPIDHLGAFLQLTLDAPLSPLLPGGLAQEARPGG